MSLKNYFLLCRFLFMVVVIVLICSVQTLAQSPPLLTDDPGTPGDGRWEINIVASFERTREHRSFEAPLFDINYGIGNNLQLKVEVPWLIQHAPGEKTQSGLGNTEVGVKWRFLDAEKHGIDMSVYPQIEFNNPTTSVERGLVERGTRFILPVQATRAFGPVELTGELGYSFARHGLNETFYGLAVARGVSRRVELLAEVYGTSANHFHENELVFNIGSIVQLTKKVNLVSAAGRSIYTVAGEGPSYSATLGLQFNFSGPLWRAK